MTDNTTFSKLQQVQAEITFILQHLKNVKSEVALADARLAHIQPTLEALLQQSFAPAAPQPPSSAAEALALFKAALQGGLRPTDPKPLDSFSGAMKPAQAPSQPAQTNSILRGLNLTGQARELLKTKDYFETIDALQKLHLGTPRDNIRRAVARANGVTGR